MKGYFYCQSYYSLSESINSLEELVITAKENQYDFIALSDYENLYGMIEFLELCQKYKIKPVLGLKINVIITIDFKNYIIEFLIFAINNVGVRDLIKLSNMIKAEQKKIYFKDLVLLQDNLFFIIPNIEDSFFYHQIVNFYIYNEKDFLLNTFLIDIKKKIKNVYIGFSLQSHYLEIIEEYVFELSKTYHIPILPINKTVYLKSEDKIVYKNLYKIFNNLSSGKNNYDFHYHFLNQQEFNDRYLKYPNIISNLKQIISIINYSNDIKILMNDFALPSFSDQDNKEILKQKSFQNLEKIINMEDISYIIYKKRLEYELKIIFQMHYENYFLIVSDIVDYAKKKFILVGPGRGSAVSSLVCFCLGITEIDPLKYNLFFERFLNPQRNKMPDIDLDFPDNKREHIIEYVRNKYKSHHVVHINTFVRFSIKFLITVIGIIFKVEANKISLLIKRVLTNNFHITDVKGHRIKNIINKIYNMPKETRIHPSGILLSKQNLMKNIPLQKVYNKINSDVFQTQFENKILQKIGLIKIDFLGIKTLDIMNQILNKIKILNIQKISLDDFKTYRLLQEQKTIGIFQLESLSARLVLKKIQPKKFSDLIDVLAFNRPGTINFINEYVKNKKNSSKIFFNSIINQILMSTHGIIIYQEQIMQIAIKFANYSLTEADNFRIAINQKNKFFLMKEKEHFINKSVQQGNSAIEANDIYNYILNFSNYSFNKSHSVAYALISYRMAYLKTNFFKEFYLIMLNNVVNNIVVTDSLIKEIKSRIIFITPNIYQSYNEYYFLSDRLIMPLILINNVTEVFCLKLMQERDKKNFVNYEDFKVRMQQYLNDNLLDNLIFSGALDIFGLNKKTLFEYKDDKYYKYVKDSNFKEFKEFSEEYLIMKKKQAFKFNFLNLKT